MSKDYVSKELARKLQEKGYPLKKVYRQDEAPLFYDLPQDHPDWSQCDAWYIPTIWEVLKWLRKKNIHIVIDIRDGLWSFELRCLRTGYIMDCTIFGGSDNYEQAAIAGIEYVLDNLI